MKRRSIVIIFSIVAFILLSPWILGSAWMVGGNLYGKIDLWRYKTTNDFRSTDWKRPNMKYRYSVLDHVTRNVIAIGMAEAEVEKALGRPDRITKEMVWEYETKRPGWHFIDFSGGGLLIEFNSDRKISRISKSLWVD